MNEKQLEEFLRENKPRVQDDPTFLLELQQRMQAVDGIKCEVDRQRRYGRKILLVTLIVGMLLGAFAVFLAGNYDCAFGFLFSSAPYWPVALLLGLAPLAAVACRPVASETLAHVLCQETGKGRLKVHATFDGVPYDGSIVNTGLKHPDGSVCYMIGVLKAIRVALGKKEGDAIHVVITERE